MVKKPGFLKTLLWESGLWQFSEIYCAWVWMDPALERHGFQLPNLEMQLAELDQREPTRIQWTQNTADDQWLDLVPKDV
ncbi:hypothetical protein PI125_g19310 [Phytophthora idaei]|nr:hypothetical protein PI125_g19310 [Phytophthora idaei]